MAGSSFFFSGESWVDFFSAYVSIMRRSIYTVDVIEWRNVGIYDPWNNLRIEVVFAPLAGKLVERNEERGIGINPSWLRSWHCWQIRLFGHRVARSIDTTPRPTESHEFVVRVFGAAVSLDPRTRGRFIF